MAFATASRKPGDNAQTATPPQAQARPHQSSGKTEPPQRARPPSMRQSPQHAPGRKPGSRASTEPSIELRIVNLAKRRVPRALAGPSSEFPQRKIVNFVQPWSKRTIFRSLKAKTRDYLRYRKAHTRTTGKNVHFSLPRPRKTVCFDRQRPKPTVFRIAHPMLNKQHFRHRSR